MTSASRGWLETAGAALLAAVLTLATFRFGRLLTFDGYYYCEFAKQFAAQWPDRFGYHWPVGYPVAGALLARIGVPAYVALVGISFAALLALLAVATRMTRPDALRGVVVLAIAAAPIVAPQWGGVLTELPFAAAWLGLAWCLARWPAAGAIWSASTLAVVALSIRYAGIIALAVIAVWIATSWPRLARRRVHALGAWASACGVTLGLLALNIARTGHASGAGRGVSLGLGALPAQFADFGWSVASALLAGGVRDRIGPASTAGLLAGGAMCAGVFALCAWSWLRPRSEFSRPLALVTGGYVTGMAVLRCIGEFDALYNARTFLPVLAPVLLMLRERLGDRRRLALVVLMPIIITGAIAAARGLSRQISGDVRAVIPAIRERILAGDQIAVNDDAYSVSAYFAQPAIRALLGNWRSHATERFVVAAGKPTRRDGAGAVCPPDWAEACAQLVAAGRYRYLVQQPDIIALERTAPPGVAR